MRTFGKMMLACGMVTLLVAPAQAQRPGGGRGFGGPGGFGGGVALLANKSVQQELKVDEKQADKLNAFAEEQMEKQREQFQKLQDLSQEERREKMQELNRTTGAAIREKLDEILKPEQVKRFQQIQLQAMSVLGAAAMPRVQEALNLTDEQRTKFRTIQEEQQESMRELFQGGGGGGDREAVMTKLADLRKKTNDKAMAVLTDSQKAAWKDLTGAPFEVRIEPGQGGPGGGFRRRNNNN
jgi:Spy/CpxP family protein refolding chaperone